MEGAWRLVKPDWIAAYPDESVTRRTAENLLNLGELTGEEYFALMEGVDRIRISGVEDRKVYQANLSTRRMMDGEREAMLRRVEKADESLKALKQTLFPAILDRLDQVSLNFGDARVSLKDYIAFFGKEFPGLLSKDRYPNVFLLSELFRREKAISTANVETEMKSVLTALSQTLDNGTLSQLAALSLEFRLGRARGVRYYTALISLADINRLSAPHIKEYLAYLKMGDEVDHDQVPREIAALEKAAYDRFRGLDSQTSSVIDLNRAVPAEKVLGRNFPEDWWTYFSTE